MKYKNKNYLFLFLTFFKISAFTFGGGYAMISLIEEEIVEKRKLVTEGDVSNIIAISESTPGPISINVATFVGYKVAGFLGAICSTLGVVCAPFFIIIILFEILQNIQNNIIFQKAFWGVRIGVIALILKVLFNMYKKCSKNIYSYSVIIFSLIMSLFFKMNAIYIIIGCIVFRLIMFNVNNRKEKT